MTNLKYPDNRDNIILVGCNLFETGRTLDLLMQVQRIYREKPAAIFLVWNGNPDEISLLPLSQYGLSHIILGTNKFWEWSGYSEGLIQLIGKAICPDSVLFLNDTAFKHEESKIIISIYCSPNCAYPFLPRSYLLGRHDRSRRNLTFELNDSFSGWISTFCFVLTKDLFHLLSEVLVYLSHFNIDNRYDETRLLDRFFYESHHTMASHLNWWLFGGGWHKSEPLTDSNYVFFRQKLRSIYGEFKLTQLCKNRAAILAV